MEATRTELSKMQRPKKRRRVQPTDDGAVEAYCARHRRLCAVTPCRPTSAGGLAINISGVPCTDWSRMGAKAKWLGETSFVFLQFMRERLVAKEQVVIVENVLDFDKEFLNTILPEYSLDVVEVSPLQLGYPISRPRIYMILLLKGRLQWCKRVREASVAEAYAKMFHRRVELRGEVLMRASNTLVAQYLQHEAAKRGLPALRASGRPWSPWQLVSPGLRCRIKEHEDQVAEMWGERRIGVVSNVSQKPQFCQTTSTTLPALLKGTTLWSHRLQRLSLAEEHLEMQGYCLFDTHGTTQIPWAEAQIESAGAGRRLAGNGMHLPVLASIVGFTLAHVVECEAP